MPHGAKGAGGDEEGLGYRRVGVDHEDREEHQAVDHGKEIEEHGGGGGAQAVDACRDAEHKAYLKEHEHPHHGRVGGKRS